MFLYYIKAYFLCVIVMSISLVPCSTYSYLLSKCQSGLMGRRFSSRSSSAAIHRLAKKKQATEVSGKDIDITKAGDPNPSPQPPVKIKKQSVAEATKKHFYIKQDFSNHQHTSSDVLFSLAVHGEPIALSRHRTTKIGFVYNPSAKYQESFLAACQPFLPITPFEGALEAKVIFHIGRPKNHFGTGKNSQQLKKDAEHWHVKRLGQYQ